MPNPKPPSRISLSELALQELDTHSAPQTVVPTSSSTTPSSASTPTPEDLISQLVRLAARVLHVPLAVVALTREYMAKCTPSPGIEPARYDRALSIGAHVLMSGAPLVVSDTLSDTRFEAHREVRDLGIRAFAGVPIRLANGAVIGAFKVRDTRARAFTPGDLDTLTLLAGFVARELELRDLAEVLAHRDREARASRPLTSRCVLVVGRPGASRVLLQDWLTTAGALVDAAEPGPATDECLNDAELVGVPYHVIVLDEGAAAVVPTLRARAQAVPIVAVCPPDEDTSSLQAAGCDELVRGPLQRGDTVVGACIRVVGRAAGQ